jgi:hypothetical protein
MANRSTAPPSTVRRDNLPDGSRRLHESGPGTPELPTHFSQEQASAIYAAVAHAHFALATLRGADIQFPPGRDPPPELSMQEPANRRFYLQLALLGMALESMGLDLSKDIPLPQVRLELG